ncbi:hypothetical protein COX69_03735 [Candidatus Falkowbacteria bacterium CG_4_10_14_0_2_um_filter_48_10]|uniref:Uncharacterized protein n=1 Tax=Candidatus Falkowbacteria bacterium CG23_combo_of_CG06-09_8_20_14_all_49_15 TaxID=1974572 RepID=A0A2G9ZKS3_9BACT|nr:MAG: hypothetical protein COX22_02545 [Candidatus Falkowbacteria bacterium CG23_combo_of_CG06-09_8_20_14_all_49_15]PJA07816.1 MAG: hypothetical protein COX69_03735 [Candidatus Falkowbacteria bacterium CG_4_10_14_0_2_um_filter_48_10]
MLEKIDEPIDVLASFGHPLVSPKFFRWRRKTYRVEKVNLVYREAEGQDKIYYFAVTDSANYFKLAFFTRDLSWRLRELWSEG